MIYLRNILMLVTSCFMTAALAHAISPNAAQQKSENCVISQYDTACIGVDKEPSSIFPQGIKISLREKHSHACWGGVGDPLTSPVFKQLHLDKFGRIFVENILEDNLIPAIAANDSVKIIDDIKQWKHPAKNVFAKYGITLKKVELYYNKTLPYFYVASHDLLKNPNCQQQKLFAKLLQANGQWDFFIVSDDGQLHYVEGKKRKFNPSLCSASF